MKRIRCPKCDNAITFDETQYEPGRTLVFECSDCHKQFKIRIPERAVQGEEEEASLPTPGSLVVIENAFHFKQIIPLVEGENVIGRFVKGTKQIETSVPNQTVTIVYDGRKTKYDDFVAAFKKIGYEIKKTK